MVSYKCHPSSNIVAHHNSLNSCGVPRYWTKGDTLVEYYCTAVRGVQLRGAEAVVQNNCNNDKQVKTVQCRISVAGQQLLLLHLAYSCQTPADTATTAEHVIERSVSAALPFLSGTYFCNFRSPLPRSTTSHSALSSCSKHYTSSLLCLRSPDVQPALLTLYLFLTFQATITVLFYSFHNSLRCLIGLIGRSQH